MYQGHAVAVVIPAYRAEKTIGSVLSGLPEWVDHIIVVDDASPDQLSAEVSRHPRANVRLLRHEHNQGVGGATVTGYREALSCRADLIIKLDADDQMDPRCCHLLLDPLLAEGFDFAKGNRFVFRSALRAMPRVRLLGNLGLTILVKAVSGQWHCVDPTNGFFALRAELLERIDLDRLARDYYFEISQIVALGIVGAAIADVPIPARYAGEGSGLSIGKVLSSFPWRLLRDYWFRLWLKYGVLSVHPILPLTICGLLLSLAGGAFGLAHWLHGIAIGVPASAGTAAISLFALLLGLGCLGLALLLDIGEAPPPYRRGMVMPCKWTEDAYHRRQEGS